MDRTQPTRTSGLPLKRLILQTRYACLHPPKHIKHRPVLQPPAAQHLIPWPRPPPRLRARLASRLRHDCLSLLRCRSTSHGEFTGLPHRQLTTTLCMAFQYPDKRRPTPALSACAPSTMPCFYGTAPQWPTPTLSSPQRGNISTLASRGATSITRPCPPSLPTVRDRSLAVHSAVRCARLLPCKRCLSFPCIFPSLLCSYLEIS
ncbi:hypothetical protein B0H14DRAFT_3011715 [Mycena olivaceomarginata]|nr:hypothetical protein B0H14DRAFT_3011715 [Mycena olivaceomarginata]